MEQEDTVKLLEDVLERFLNNECEVRDALRLARLKEQQQENAAYLQITKKKVLLFIFPPAWFDSVLHIKVPVIGENAVVIEEVREHFRNEFKQALAMGAIEWNRTLSLQRPLTLEEGEKLGINIAELEGKGIVLLLDGGRWNSKGQQLYVIHHSDGSSTGNCTAEQVAEEVKRKIK